MFLKRIKPNKRILYNKYFIDPWASIIIKKKLKNRTTQRFLQFFGRYLITTKFSGRRAKPAHLRKPIKHRPKLRRGAIKTKQSSKTKRPRKSKIKNKRGRSRFNKNKRVTNVVDKKKWKSKPAAREFIKPVKRVARDPLRSFIYARMRFYACYKASAHNMLIHGWWKQARRTLSARFKKRWGRFQPYPPTFFWFKRRKEYIITQLMDLVFQQYHYGFTSFSSFKCYVRRYGGGEYDPVVDSRLGIEGMLANQVCRGLCLLNIRQAYLLVRSGGVAVNAVKTKNPRAMLRLGDTFKLSFPFSKMCLKYYARRLRRRRYIFKPPGYFEINYKIMAFKIWRKPSRRERRLINYYPFFKNELTSTAIKYYKWITE